MCVCVMCLRVCVCVVCMYADSNNQMIGAKGRYRPSAAFNGKEGE
jgi:hypothetical protein